MRLSRFLRLLLFPFLPLIVAVALFSAAYSVFNRLTDETLIAELSFKQLSEDEYLVNLSTGDFCDVLSYEIHGDQWRLDASFLKWKYWATALGMESQYRLDRIEGRYADVGQQNTGTHLAHKLGEPTVLDLVTLSANMGKYNFLADAAYGTSTYQSIDPSRIYEVYKTPTGIITRQRENPGFDLQDDYLSIEINRACGGEPDIWMQFSLMLNDLILDAT